MGRQAEALIDTQVVDHNDALATKGPVADASYSLD